MFTAAMEINLLNWVVMASLLSLLWLCSTVARTGLLVGLLVASSVYGSDVFYAFLLYVVPSRLWL